MTHYSHTDTITDTPNYARGPIQITNFHICSLSLSQNIAYDALSGTASLNVSLSRHCRFFVNATLGSALSSPLESPDIMQRFIVANDIGAATTSMASIKLSSGESINSKSRQVRPIRSSIISHSSTRNPSLANANVTPAATQLKYTPTSVSIFAGLTDRSIDGDDNKTPSRRPIREYPSAMVAPNSFPINLVPSSSVSSASLAAAAHQHKVAFTANGYGGRTRDYFMQYSARQAMLEFSISSVGRSFIDEAAEAALEADEAAACESLHTPDTPTPNISPTSSSNRISEAFSNDFIKAASSPSAQVSPLGEQAGRQFLTAMNRDKTSSCAGSWDLLELDLNFDEVNLDPSFGGDVEERMFFGDDPLGILPRNPTMPDTLDL